MKKFIILPDVTCDLSEELRTKFGLEDYIEGYVHFSDGRDLKTTLDWSNISREEFYKTLSNKKMEVSTAPASPEDYYEFYKKYAEQGYDILAMSISSKISSTHNVAAGAAKRVMEEYPDCNIYCFDSLRMAGALGLLVIYAVITVIRQVVEPKLVANQAGLPAIVTIMAMFLGVRIFGAFGIILLPFTVIILKLLYDEGVFKTKNTVKNTEKKKAMGENK